MSVKNSTTVCNMLYPQNRLHELKMEDQNYKRDWMKTVTSEDIRRDYFNRPIRVNFIEKGISIY